MRDGPLRHATTARWRARSSTWRGRCAIACACSGLSLEQALRLASVNPAAFLGLEVGRLAPGYRADMVALDPEQVAGAKDLDRGRRNRRMNDPIIALTGATGFIGNHLLHALTRRGYRIRVLLRSPAALPPGCTNAVIGDLNRPINMAAALAGVDTVIHSAGLAPTMTGSPDEDFRRLNTAATGNLAQAAQHAGVRRFIYLSSLRAQADVSARDVLTEDLPPVPTDAYGRSKLAAEQELSRHDLDWVALRLALVFGPGVKGNIARLVDARAVTLLASVRRAAREALAARRSTIW